MIIEIETEGDNTYHIIVGQNAQENWDIIDNASQKDIWFHLDDHPSPHVILHSENTKLKKIPKKIKKKAAILCKEHSKFKHIHKQKIAVIYTSIKNIKKGSIVGQVIVGSKTLKIMI